jgi:hypothetical protein
LSLFNIVLENATHKNKTQLKSHHVLHRLSNKQKVDPPPLSLFIQIVHPRCSHTIWWCVRGLASRHHLLSPATERFFGGSGGFGCSELFFLSDSFRRGRFYLFLCDALCFVLVFYGSVLCFKFFVGTVLLDLVLCVFQFCGFGVVCTVFYFCLCSRFLFFP